MTLFAQALIDVTLFAQALIDVTLFAQALIDHYVRSFSTSS